MNNFVPIRKIQFMIYLPTNYEEKMVDLNARKDLESWNPIK
jgi:hypothetical protein